MSPMMSISPPSAITDSPAQGELLGLYRLGVYRVAQRGAHRLQQGRQHPADPDPTARRDKRERAPHCAVAVPPLALDREHY